MHNRCVGRENPIRIGFLALLLAASTPLTAAAQPADAVPQALLPDVATPLACRLDFTLLPDQPRFSGHAEIDIDLKAATQSLYLHSRSLRMAKVAV